MGPEWDRWAIVLQELFPFEPERFPFLLRLLTEGIISRSEGNGLH